MVMLVFLSGFFSMSETAFSCMNRTKVRTLAENGNKRANRALKLVNKYDQLLSTILIGNNIVNIILATLATVFFVAQLNGEIGPTIATVVTTVAVLIFGEITPKSIASDFPESIACGVAYIIQLLVWIFYPLVFIFSLWKKLISLIFKPKNKNKMSQEELLTFVDEVQEEGSIDSNEGELLRNAIEFSEIEAEEILTHRTKLEAVSIDTDKEELDQIYRETQYSRIIIFEDDIDHIVGFIHQKDFYDRNGIVNKPLKELLSPVIFVPQVEKISLTLSKLQKNKTHVAVVVDEYGGTLGIVTMEDILEELVGEIWDEHDEVVEYFKKISERAILVDTECTLDDFEKYFNIKADEEIATLPEWITENLNKIPEINDVFTFENLKIRINKIEEGRVSKILVTKKDKEKE